MTLEVIGAGFGRTGTMSLKVALEESLSTGRSASSTVPTSNYSRTAGKQTSTKFARSESSRV